MGSHLCERLLNEGNEVWCVDNLITGDRNNINLFEQNPNFKFKNLTVMELQSLGEEKFDRVYHLASPASPSKHNPKSYLALPFETMAVNSMGTWISCQFAKNSGARFLFASTSEIYGDPLEHPQKESYNGNVSTTGPRSVYDESKRFGETITSSFVRDKELDGRIVRIFNTYGERMADDGRVVINFLNQALSGQALTVYGDGSQTRSFCYVSDMVDGLIKTMETGDKGGIYNLGNPDEYTIIELAEKIVEMTGSSSEIKVVEDLPEDDPLLRRPDITLAREKLGWEPKVGLEEGLRKLLHYSRNKLIIG